MRNSYQPFVSLLFTCLILLAAFTVLQPFLLSIVWAGLIAISSWPLHKIIRSRLPKRRNLAAACSTTVIALMLALPLIALLVFIAEDIRALATFLIEANATGKAVPLWLGKLPLAGDFLTEKWAAYLGQPSRLTDLFSAKLNTLQDFAHSLLVNILSRAATLFFALWVLFFFFRDGEKLVSHFSRLGFKWLEQRWPSYAYHIPPAVRSTVNGLVLVGLAEGVILSALFAVFQVHSAVLLGMVTAAIAFVPLAAPLLLALIGTLLFVQDAPVSGILVFSLGTTIIMLADYLVRPQLIQRSTALPFLAILFGIFGGIATMGILGLIIGPVILVLFLVLLNEAIRNDGDDFDL